MGILDGVVRGNTGANKSQTFAWVEKKIADVQMMRFHDAFYLSKDVAELAPVDKWLWKERSTGEKLVELSNSMMKELAGAMSDEELSFLVETAERVRSGDELSDSENRKAAKFTHRAAELLRASGSEIPKEIFFKLEKHDDSRPLTQEETAEALENHWTLTSALRDELLVKYRRGVNILAAIIENGRQSVESRPEKIVYGSKVVVLESGKRKFEYETLSLEEMEKELETIIKKPFEELTALDVALKNAYATYLAKKTPSWAAVRNEQIMLQQCLSTISEIPELMTGLVNMTDDFVRDFVKEVRHRDDVNGTTYAFDDRETKKADGSPMPLFRIPPDALRRVVLEELGGNLRPFIGSREVHERRKALAWSANAKGRTGRDPYEGSLELPSFDRQTLLVVGPPGAGKDSILRAFTRKLFMKLKKYNTPQLNSADKSIPIIDSKTQEMNSATNQAVLTSVLHPSLLVLNEIFQTNPDGTGILKTSQDWILNGVVNQMNGDIREHPGTQIIGVGNDDSHGYAENFDIPDDAMLNRFIVVRMTQDMIMTKWPSFLEDEFGSLVKPGQPAEILLRFMQEKDNMGLLGYFSEYRPRSRSSLHEALDNVVADTRAMTMLLESFVVHSGPGNVGMKQITDWLGAVAGPEVVGMFNTFAKVYSSIRTRNEIADAVAEVPSWSGMVALESSFSYDRESRRFRLDGAPISAFCRLADPEKILGPEFRGEVERYRAQEAADLEERAKEAAEKGKPAPKRILRWDETVLNYIDNQKSILAKNFPELEGKRHSDVVAEMKEKLDADRRKFSSKVVEHARTDDAEKKTKLEKEMKKLEKTLAAGSERLKSLTGSIAGIHKAEKAYGEFLDFAKTPVTMKNGRLSGPLVEFVERTANNTWGLKREVLEAGGAGLGGVNGDSLMVSRLISNGQIEELRANIETAINEKTPVDGEVFKKACIVFSHCPQENTRDAGLVAIRDLFDLTRNKRIAEHLYDFGFTRKMVDGSVKTVTGKSMEEEYAKREAEKRKTEPERGEKSNFLLAGDSYSTKMYTLLMMIMRLPGFDGTVGDRIRDIVGMNNHMFDKLKKGGSALEQFASSDGR